MRVDPKPVKKTATANAPPAAKPKTEFAAVLKQGREAAPQTPPLPQSPAKQAASKPPLPKALQEDTPRPQGPVKGNASPAEEQPLLAPVQGPDPQQQQLAPPVDAASEAAPAAPVVPIERIADEVLLIARPDGSHEIQAEVESKVIADLRISVTQRGDKIEVRLLTDTPATQRTLEQALPQLTQALQTRNLNPSLVQVLPRAYTPPAAFAGSPEGRRQQQREGGGEGGGREGRGDRGRR